MTSAAGRSNNDKKEPITDGSIEFWEAFTRARVPYRIAVETSRRCSSRRDDDGDKYERIEISARKRRINGVARRSQ